MRLTPQRPQLSLWITFELNKYCKTRWAVRNCFVRTMFSCPLIQLHLPSKFTSNSQLKRNLNMKYIPDFIKREKKFKELFKNRIKMVMQAEKDFLESSENKTFFKTSFKVSKGPIGVRYARLVKSFETLNDVNDGLDLTVTDVPITHEINTFGKPVNHTPLLLNSDSNEYMEHCFAMLSNLGIIRPSESQWANTLSYAQDPFEITGNYSFLNFQTMPDPYQLPSIEDLITPNVQMGKVFSSIHLKRMFHQIPIAEKDIEKTAIITQFGQFEFMRMPMGLRNASQTIQKFMNHVLLDLPFVKCHVDQILVFSINDADHFRHLAELFEVLVAAKIKVNWEKCTFGCPEVFFCGCIIKNDIGFIPTDRMIQVILNYPIPKDSIELYNFLCLVNQYSDCVPLGYTYLKELVRSRCRIKWSQEEILQFEKCKQHIADLSLGRSIDAYECLILRTHISQQGALGATLETQLADGNAKPLGFFSGSVKMSYFNSFKPILAAIYEAIKFFQSILESRKFYIYTNLHVLKNTLHYPVSSITCIQYMNFISQFNYYVIYSSDLCNYAAKSISEVEIMNLPAQLDPDLVVENQARDLQFLTTTWNWLYCYMTVNNYKMFCVLDENVPKLYIPQSMQRQVFSFYYEEMDSERIILKKISQHCFWPNMQQDVKKWLRQCTNKKLHNVTVK